MADIGASRTRFRQKWAQAKMGPGRQKGTAMEFDVLTGALGAEVSGLNLNEPLSGAAMDALHQGLTQHHV